MNTTQSISDAKDSWRTIIHNDGGVCPCCDRWGKVYGRAINKTMADSLEWLYHKNTAMGVRTWIDVPNTAPTFVIRSNQLPTLRWWGLVERQEKDPTDKLQKHSGKWRITLKGADFVEGKLLVPKKVFTYNGEVTSTSDELVAFSNCTGDFDYEATMMPVPVAVGGALFAAGTSPSTLNNTKENHHVRPQT